MTRSVVFKTPGLIPIEAFTHFGVNAKPNSSNPIGYFGTGLKYAIAVLVREGLKPVVWIGSRKYTFFPKDKDFRGKEFTFIRMRRKTLIGTITYHDLPFTTELGKNWELWQAFRELESNTRDENGETFIANAWTEPHSDRTHIVIEGDEFVREFENIERTFLSDALTAEWENEKLLVYDRPSEYVYFRGINVHKLAKPSKFTYNILEATTLTEDRTIAYPHVIEQVVGTFAAQSDDGAFIKRIVEHDDKHWEGSMRWDYIYSSPAKKFMQVMQSSYGSSRWNSAPSARSYYSGYAPKSAKISPLAGFPTPWEVDSVGIRHEEEVHNVVFDATGKVLFSSMGSDRRETHYEEDEENGGAWQDIGTYGLFKYIVDKINAGED